MILPTKGITPDRALLSLGGEVLQLLTEPRTVSRLWADLMARSRCSRLTFDWFVLTLDLLYMMGLIAYQEGLIVPVRPLAEDAT